MSIAAGASKPSWTSPPVIGRWVISDSKVAHRPAPASWTLTTDELHHDASALMAAAGVSGPL